MEVVWIVRVSQKSPEQSAVEIQGLFRAASCKFVDRISFSAALLDGVRLGLAPFSLPAFEPNQQEH